MEEIEFESVTTRAGDEGQTSLLSGERRYKSEMIFEVLGDLDELSGNLGLFRLELTKNSEWNVLAQEIFQIQKLLITLGGLVASPVQYRTANPQVVASYETAITDGLDLVETWERHWLQGIRFEGFIVPGAAPAPAWADLSRTVCRRLERHLVHYIHESYTEHLRTSLQYLNRLSDYLWVVGRYLVRQLGISEI